MKLHFIEKRPFTFFLVVLCFIIFALSHTCPSYYFQTSIVHHSPVHVYQYFFVD